MLNRRNFLKTTTLATAASAFPLLCTAAQPDKKLGIALVGLGSYSTGQLAPALQETKHCELKGIVTGSPRKIPKWQRQYNIKDSNVYSYENMHTIADNPDIDVIYIVVPTALHMKYAVIAANAGKHVWCEKPMAMTADQCQEIIDACNKNKVKLSIGYRMLHEPNTQRLIQYSQQKTYGTIQNITAQAGYMGGGGTGWRYEKAMGGGAMYDMGVYTVNGARNAARMEPIAVSARHILTRPELFKEVDETTQYTLEFPEGVICDGRTSVGENINKLRVDAANGWYELSPMQAYGGVGGTTSDNKVMTPITGRQQTIQMDDDALAIFNNTKVIATGEEGMKDIRIIEAIFASAANGGKRIPLI